MMITMIVTTTTAAATTTTTTIKYDFPVRDVKANGELEIQLHSCLTLVLGGERPSFSCGRVVLGKDPFSRSRLGPRAGCRTVERIFMKFSIGEFIANSRVISV
jgi:hypothetical protein